MQVVLALKLLNDHFLVKTHVNKMLDGISNEIVVNQLPITILSYLLQDWFSQKD